MCEEALGFRPDPRNPAWFQRLKVNHYKLLSKFAFNFNLRPYTKAQAYLEDWCRTLHNSTLVQKVKDNKCVIQDFRDYVENDLYQIFPVQREDFDEAFESFVTNSSFVKAHMKAGLMGFDNTTNTSDPCRVGLGRKCSKDPSTHKKNPRFLS